MVGGQRLAALQARYDPDSRPAGWAKCATGAVPELVGPSIWLKPLAAAPLLPPATLRRSLASLLQGKLGLDISRSQAGKLVMRDTDEAALSEWMAENAAVA